MPRDVLEAMTAGKYPHNIGVLQWETLLPGGHQYIVVVPLLADLDEVYMEDVRPNALNEIRRAHDADEINDAEFSLAWRNITTTLPVYRVIEPGDPVYDLADNGIDLTGGE